MAPRTILLENYMRKKFLVMAMLEKHTDWCGFAPSEKFKQDGHMIKFLLTELGWARRENIWFLVRTPSPSTQ